MDIIQLSPEMVHLLKKPIAELGNYHNEIATSFSGVYPLRLPEATVQSFAEHIPKGDIIVEALMDGQEILGFSQISLDGVFGAIKYLFIYAQYRGNGYGDLLMTRALRYFEGRQISFIDVEVVSGNPSITFYQKYGFALRSSLLSKRIRADDS